VKRIDLTRHMETSGCRLLREGASHSLYINPQTQKVSTVPRHRETNDFPARKSCRNLDIDEP
jgi:mRNA interferase HicA